MFGKSVTIKGARIGVFGAIIASIAAVFLANYLENNNAKVIINDSQVAGDVVAGDQINNNNPTEIQERKDRYASANETKIIGFLRYRNNGDYYEASNNIYKKLSYKFTQERLQEFHENMTNLFITINITLVGQVAIGMDFVASKHLVEVSYSYQGKDYIDSVLFSVRQNISDARESHIDLVQCKDKEVKTPLCDFLKD